VDVLSGDPGPSDALFCLLLGTTTPLPDERLAEMYPTRDDYAERYQASADTSIEAWVVLPEDEDALLAASQPDRIGG
jgi:hypothetical protein